MLKKIFIGSIIFFILLGVLICYCLIPNKGSFIVDKYLKQGSVWRYENEKMDVEMELAIDFRTGKDNIVKYNIKNRMGQWIFSPERDSRTLSFYYIADDASCLVWSGKGKIRSDKIMIKDIEINKELSEFVNDKNIPQKVEEETLPKEIKEIVFERVK